MREEEREKQEEEEDEKEDEKEDGTDLDLGQLRCVGGVNDEEERISAPVVVAPVHARVVRAGDVPHDEVGSVPGHWRVRERMWDGR